MDQLQTLPMEIEPLEFQPLEPVPKVADFNEPEVQPLATEVQTEEVPAKGVQEQPAEPAGEHPQPPASGQKPSAQPPLSVVAPEKIAELAEAEKKLNEDAAATAAEADAFRRQQLQMKLDEKEKAEAARNAKKDAKAAEPKPKGKAKGRPRKTDEEEKENNGPVKKKKRASAEDATQPADAATGPVVPAKLPKRKAAADGEQKVKKPRAKKEKVGNMDVDEDLVF